ncbi:hypothetical protein [Dictyobacter kobayashii]|uniref:Uncharacterized protein n=1 Tax=Dictyobacter kobayashii TaxID=2014872 RepID=A0A402AEX9_9CHLR|nr:hypothetical protein [Dictyobacter kobayashii]GCE17670.1 hypothetical protein KDK_14700 [Dictyobacter kobayashii]
MSKSISLENYKKAFARDGSLRDLYIPKTQRNDWECILNYVQRRSDFTNILFIDQHPHPLDVDIQELFHITSDHAVLLRIDAKQLQLHCHFFEMQKIEFDFDPSVINTDDRLNRLMEFIHNISVISKKCIFLTPENEENVHYYSYNPETGDEKWSLPEWESYKILDFKNIPSILHEIEEKHKK